MLEPLAASLAVLTGDERELGCAIVELGAGSTNVAIFHGGKIRHTGSIRMAGGHVTGDIVYGLQVTQQDAERLKERSGSAYEPLVPENDIIELPGTPGQGARTAHRRVLAHIMHKRMEEILQYALDEISQAGYHQRLPAGVVLTGGGALTPGIVELAPRGLRDAGAGRDAGPGPLRAWPTAWSRPARRCSRGWRCTGPVRLPRGAPSGPGPGAAQSMERYLGPVKRWLQDFF